MVRVTLTGLDETLAHVTGTHKLALQRVAAVLKQGGETIVATMKEGHPPGGPWPDHLGPRGKLPRWPMHKFIDRTGALTRSMGYSVESWTGRTLQLNGFATAKHADSVEYGTPRSRPDPFFWPSVYKVLPTLQTKVQAAVAQAYAERAVKGSKR